MALHSPDTFAQIVDSYLDAWRKRGWMPDCRANNLPGWTQGGSSGDVIVGHFAINYHNEASELGISLDDILEEARFMVGRNYKLVGRYGEAGFDLAVRRAS